MEKIEKNNGGITNESVNENNGSRVNNNDADPVEKQTVTCRISNAKLWRPTGARKNFDMFLSKDVTVYQQNPDDVDGPNIPVTTNKINILLSVVMHALNQGKSKRLAYLYSLAGSRFTDEVVAALTNAQIKFTINPHTMLDTYEDEDGDEVNYENNGQHYEIEYINIDDDMFMCSVEAIQLWKAKQK